MPTPAACHPPARAFLSGSHGAAPYHYVTSLNVPVYFLHGIFDYACSYALTRSYFDKLKAPLKGFYTFRRSALCQHQSRVSLSDHSGLQPMEMVLPQGYDGGKRRRAHGIYGAQGCPGVAISCRRFLIRIVLIAGPACGNLYVFFPWRQ